MGDTVLPELAGRELLPGHSGGSLSEGAARYHQPGGRVVHREGRVEDVLLRDDEAVVESVHSEQEPASQQCSSHSLG